MAVEHRETIKSYGVKRLGLFGSAARGEGRKTSDLDFVVEFEKKSFDSYMDLKAFLEELFHRRIDLVLADANKPRLRKNILKDAPMSRDYREFRILTFPDESIKKFAGFVGFGQVSDSHYSVLLRSPSK